ncbi:hypothetical protein [Peribacillus frigoritolerans]|uniref:hypothetical protein n=1 Tax=Peribacillus frigoritolerans TaxID=450367 RepID=UPI0034407C4D
MGNKLDKPLMKRMKILKSPKKYRTSSISVAILAQHFILPSFSKLETNIPTDVLIVGAELRVSLQLLDLRPIYY